MPPEEEEGEVSSEREAFFFCDMFVSRYIKAGIRGGMRCSVVWCVV